MKVFTLVFTISLCNFFYGQKLSIEKREDSLLILLKSVRKTTNDKEMIEKNTIMKTFLQETIQLAESFNYPFSKIKSIGIIDSKDKSVRVYNWNILLSDKTNRYFCYIVRPGKRKTKLIELIDKSISLKSKPNDVFNENNWYGALYYSVIPVKSEKKNTYTLLGWKANGTISNQKIIEAISIQGNHIKLGLPIFNTKTDVLKRYIIEYAKNVTVSLKHDPEFERIIFDHVSPETSSMKGFPEYYIPDMSWDAFTLHNDHWVITEDVITKNIPEEENQKITTTVLDPKTGIEQEKVFEKAWINPVVKNRINDK